MCPEMYSFRLFVSEFGELAVWALYMSPLKKTQGNKMADIGSWLLVYVRLYSGSLFFFFVGDLFLVELNGGIT